MRTNAGNNNDDPLSETLAGESASMRRAVQIPSVDCARVRSITDQYADAPLECDGLTNVLHYYLQQTGIDHVVYEGTVQDLRSGQLVAWHRWITFQSVEGRAVVDYRLQMWLGKSMCHGVFLAAEEPDIQYVGEPVHLPDLPAPVIRLLIASASGQSDPQT